MKNLHYEIKINAPVEKVWNIMLADKTYREWTSAFMEGSYYDGNWEKGSPIKFLAPEEDGTVSGMVSEIAENKPNEFISIRHLGQMIKGVEDTSSEEAKKWSGALENYTFKSNGETTELTIDLTGIDEEMAAMFDGMWPKALEKLKEISEK